MFARTERLLLRPGWLEDAPALARPLEMGYWIARPYWGLGFATEAGRQLVRIARAMQLPKLTAGHFLDNPASGAVLRKLGFRPTGQIAQRYSVARGRDVACALFEEGEGDGSDVVTPMRGRIDSDADFREQFRLIAA